LFDEAVTTNIKYVSQKKITHKNFLERITMALKPLTEVKELPITQE
jgi:hypothetical protein